MEKKMDREATVLVVDDNIDFSKNIQDILELHGFKVKIACDGITGIEIVKQGDIDLVLMDIKMPVMNGVDAFKKMKKIKKDLPVIMITGFAVEELINDALRNGAFAILKKPLDFDKLVGLIDNVDNCGSMILVIDDDTNICDNLNDILTLKGYKVSIAYDGNSAIDLVKENNYNIMLLDMKLPPLNGLATYLEIRKIRPNLTAIIISGHLEDMKKDIDKAIKNNAYTCIKKPIDIDLLISTIENINKLKIAEKIRKTGDH
jgi:two-component system, NtrC family, response regulator HydG